MGSGWQWLAELPTTAIDASCRTVSAMPRTKGTRPFSRSAADSPLPLQRRNNRIRKRHRIVWRDERAISRPDQLRHAAHRRGYDGPATRQGLQDHIRTSFAAARQAEEIGGPDPLRDLANEAAALKFGYNRERPTRWPFDADCHRGPPPPTSTTWK